MKTLKYDGRTFWQVSDHSAIRHHKNDRMEILTWEDGGEVQYKTRTVKPWFFKDVKSMFEREGIA